MGITSDKENIKQILIYKKLPEFGTLHYVCTCCGMEDIKPPLTINAGVSAADLCSVVHPCLYDEETCRAARLITEHIRTPREFVHWSGFFGHGGSKENWFLTSRHINSDLDHVIWWKDANVMSPQKKGGPLDGKNPYEQTLFSLPLNAQHLTSEQNLTIDKIGSN